jgi:hypothetical protein
LLKLHCRCGAPFRYPHGKHQPDCIRCTALAASDALGEPEGAKVGK